MMHKVQQICLQDWEYVMTHRFIAYDGLFLTWVCVFVVTLERPCWIWNALVMYIITNPSLPCKPIRLPEEYSGVFVHTSQVTNLRLTYVALTPRVNMSQSEAQKLTTARELLQGGMIKQWFITVKLWIFQFVIKLRQISKNCTVSDAQEGREK